MFCALSQSTSVFSRAVSTYRWTRCLCCHALEMVAAGGDRGVMSQIHVTTSHGDCQPFFPDMLFFPCFIPVFVLLLLLLPHLLFFFFFFFSWA
jgi:hypothetical protein